MEFHYRYMHFPTVNIFDLLAENDVENKDFSKISCLIRSYIEEMTQRTLNIDKLVLCKMLLCYEYQQGFYNINNRKSMYDNWEEFLNLEAIFLTYLRNVKETVVLRDITILVTVLHSHADDPTFLMTNINSFLTQYDKYITDIDSRAVYMKILEYLLDALLLHYYFNNNMISRTDQEHFMKDLGSAYLRILKLWIEVKEESEWKSIAFMFPKLEKIFAHKYVLLPLWDYMVNENKDLKDSLTTLSIMADMCFTITHICHKIFSSNKFWLLILEGLQSSMHQSRKQALYIMKSAIDCMIKVCITNLELTRAPIIPFICRKSDDAMSSVREKFFLVYEILEEKQYHLIAPALIHINSLMSANMSHIESCDDCFNVVWLQCILKKVLLHQNNNLVKWGVSYVCKLDLIVFDNEFLELFVDVLNTNFLYECPPDEDRPKLVGELSALLVRAEEEGADLLNRFFNRISKILWDPIALFYILHTLRVTSRDRIQHSSWRADELAAVETLIETNLCMHSHVLRIASQIELLTALPDYVREIDDLTLVANILDAFPSDEAFVRGTFSWNIIVMWLQKVLKREVAMVFVQDTCAQYMLMKKASVTPRTFAKMILLLYDANHMFTGVPCAAENALTRWLRSLDFIDLRPYADTHLNVIAAEFMSHLMNTFKFYKICPSDGIGRIILFIYKTFDFLVKNVKKINPELTYDDYMTYVNIASSHLVNAHFFISTSHRTDYVRSLQNEALSLLTNVEQCQSVQYLYGLHILYFSLDIIFLPQALELTKNLLNDDNLARIDSVHVNSNTDEIKLKGKIASQYYLLLAKLMHQYLDICTFKGDIPVAALLFKLLKFIELGGTEIISQVVKILTLMVNNDFIKQTEDQETLKYIFELCCKHIFAIKKNNMIWDAVENLTEMVVNDKFFLHYSNAEFVTKVSNFENLC